jgi:hypothetical protein
MNRSYSREDLIQDFWPWWSKKMTERYGENSLIITHDNCIADWLVVNYGHEIESDDRNRTN